MTGVKILFIRSPLHTFVVKEKVVAKGYRLVTQCYTCMLNDPLMADTGLEKHPNDNDQFLCPICLEEIDLEIAFVQAELPKTRSHGKLKSLYP